MRAAAVRRDRHRRGHNGLTAAAYLARAGRTVLVLERRHVVGGAAVTEEIAPGFRFSVCSYVVSLLRPEIIRDLDLARHGLEILPLDGTFTPMPNGDYLWRTNDHAQTFREIARHSRLDAEAYDEYGRALIEMSRFAKPLLAMTPPDPFAMRLRELRPLRALARRFAALPEGDRHNQLQLLTMSAADFLDQWFETDALKATMAASGIIGTMQGVRSPGTAYVLLHHYMGEIDGAFRSWGLSRGGTGAVSNAIASAARAAGADIRVTAPVSQILVSNGAATGVVLDNGDTFAASAVLSSADPRVTFLTLVGAGHLPAEFVEDIRRYKFRGSSGKVNLALDGLPEFTCRPGAGPHLRGAVSISPGVDYMERAYDEAKYGRYSRRPYIDIVIPTLTDPVPGAAGQARDVVLRAVRALRPRQPTAAVGRTPRGVRRRRDRHDRGVRAHHPATASLHRQIAHAAGPRARVRPHRGQHLSRRADARAVVLPPARPRAGPVRDARPRASTCADSGPIRAAASWARPGERRDAGAGGREDLACLTSWSSGPA